MPELQMSSVLLEHETMVKLLGIKPEYNIEGIDVVWDNIARCWRLIVEYEKPTNDDETK